MRAIDNRQTKPRQRLVRVRLIVDNLSVERGGRLVLERLSLAVAAGECLIVRGANGAGKSTLLRAVAGLIRPVAGAVRVEGGSAEREVGEQCHYVGHGNGQRPGQTAAGAVAFWAAFLGEPLMAGSATAILDRLHLGHLSGMATGMLSAGQQRRLAFARLLAAPRPIWLLDEPTVALDARAQATMEDLITEHVSKGGMALVTTHAPLAVTGARTLDLDDMHKTAA